MPRLLRTKDDLHSNSIVKSEDPHQTTVFDTHAVNRIGTGSSATAVTDHQPIKANIARRIGSGSKGQAATMRTTVRQPGYNGPMSEGPKRDWRIGTGVVAFGAIAGFFVWAVSPWLTGHKEPWDADGPLYRALAIPYYFWYVFAVGVVAGAAIPRWFWACPVGMYIGQANAIILLLRPDPLSEALLGFLVMLPLMSGLTLMGSSIGAATRKLIGAMLWLGATVLRKISD